MVPCDIPFAMKFPTNTWSINYLLSSVPSKDKLIQCYLCNYMQFMQLYSVVLLLNNPDSISQISVFFPFNTFYLYSTFLTLKFAAQKKSARNCEMDASASIY